MFPSVKIESCKSEMHTIATHNSSPSRSHRFTHIRTQSNGGLARPHRHGPRGQRGPPCPRVSIPRSPQPAGTSLLPVPPFPQLGDPHPVPCRSPHDAALPVCVQVTGTGPRSRASRSARAPRPLPQPRASSSFFARPDACVYYIHCLSSNSLRCTGGRRPGISVVSDGTQGPRTQGPQFAVNKYLTNEGIHCSSQ